MDAGAVVVRTAAEAADRAVLFSGPLVSAFLSDALAVQDEQLRLLQDIDKKVQTLIDCPGKAGRLKLEELSLPNRKPDDVQRLLAGAADDFIDAISLQDEGSFAMAQACVDLAGVRALQCDPDAMRHYATTGYHAARQAMFTLTEKERVGKRPPYGVRTRHLNAVRDASTWFEELEFRAAALGDPQPIDMVPEPTVDRTTLQLGGVERDLYTAKVAWRTGAELDYYYTKVWRYGLPGYKPAFVTNFALSLSSFRHGTGSAWREFMGAAAELHEPGSALVARLPPWQTKPDLTLSRDA
jgi:hypothetical protein